MKHAIPGKTLTLISAWAAAAGQSGAYLPPLIEKELRKLGAEGWTTADVLAAIARAEERALQRHLADESSACCPRGCAVLLDPGCLPGLSWVSDTHATTLWLQCGSALTGGQVVNMARLRIEADGETVLDVGGFVGGRCQLWEGWKDSYRALSALAVWERDGGSVIDHSAPRAGKPNASDHPTAS